MSNKYTAKRKESNKRYKEKLSRIDVWLTPEEKEQIKEQAKSVGKSMGAYIRSQIGFKDTPMQEEQEKIDERD